MPHPRNWLGYILRDDSPLPKEEKVRFRMTRTPGPWQASRYVHRSEYNRMPKEWRDQRRREEARIVRGPGVLGTPGCNPVCQAANPADVPLIAAAPDLLRLCEEIYAHVGTKGELGLALDGTGFPVKLRVYIERAKETLDYDDL